MAAEIGHHEPAARHNREKRQTYGSDTGSRVNVCIQY